MTVYGGCAPRTHPGKYENGKSDGFAPAKKNRPRRFAAGRCEGMTIQEVLPCPTRDRRERGAAPPKGRFSAGSRDCRGGGGEPPLHVRVREKHIWRGCHGERNAFTDAAYFHTPAIFPSERAKARQRRARHSLNRHSPSHLRKIQRRHAFNIRGVKYPLLVRRKRRVRVRHLTVAVEHFP